MAPKICVLTSVHPALDVRIFHKECRSLARAGYSVTLISPIDNNREIDGITVRAFPKYSSRTQRLIRGVAEMYRAAKREKADIYHFHDPELIPVGLILRCQGKQVVYDIHEDLPKTICYKDYIPRWLKLPLQIVLGMVEEWASCLMSGVIAATKPIAERFTKTRNVAVVHNYPLLEEFANVKTMDRESNDYIAYVGARITPGRGAFEMVEAMALLPPSDGIQLRLAGSIDPSLCERLSKLRGWNRIVHLGVLSRGEVVGMLQKARAGIVLLHPEPNYLNAQPVKLFEYMLAGIPVVASDFPVWRNIIEECGCGLLVNPLDPSAIARAIEYICNHPSEAAEMGRRGQAAVNSRYNWTIEERSLLKFYEKLAGPAPAVISAQIGARA